MDQLTTAFQTIQGIIKRSHCSSRKRGVKQQCVSDENQIGATVVEKPPYEYDAASDSTESGELSDGSEDFVVSADGSDTDVATTETLATETTHSVAGSESFSGLWTIRPPPGLELIEPMPNTDMTNTRGLNVEAAPFIPGASVERVADRLTPGEVAQLKALLRVAGTEQMAATSQSTAKSTARHSVSHGAEKKMKSRKTEHIEEPKATLQETLTELSNMDSTRVLMLRKINKLGPRHASMLESHFSNFGKVERVMASYSRAKSIYNNAATRVRVVGLAFVVMSRPEEVQAALDYGNDHDLQGVGINVFPFKGRPDDVMDTEA
jgi:hypothetical protein